MLRIPDSRYRIPDSIHVDFGNGFQRMNSEFIPEEVSGFQELDYVQNYGFHKKNLPGFRIPDYLTW